MGRLHLVAVMDRQRASVLLAVLTAAALAACSQNPPSPPNGATSIPKGEPLRAAQLARRHEELDRTLWASEVLAQRHEAVFTRLWDELRTSRDKFAVLRSFPFQRLVVARQTSSQEFDWSIVQTRYGAAGASGDAGASKFEQDQVIGSARLDAWSRRFQSLGFEIKQTEWHHAQFTPPGENSPARSVVAMVLQLSHRHGKHALTLRGNLKVTWARQVDPDAEPTPVVIDARGLELMEREAAPAFHRAVRVQPEPARPDRGQKVIPLIVHDLDKDGLPEIILGGANAVLWNRGQFQFQQRDLIDQKFALRHTGCLADFDGDGDVDLLGVDQTGHGVLCEGQASGQFAAPRPCWEPVAEFPSAVTAGDVDADGDLDVWFTQYKPPYMNGQMPTPYYDANDGHPSYLFFNDGRGNFEDGTQRAGLANKRRRRTYSSSLYDLDDDQDLDLLVVSDFSGLDLYANDGNGTFHEVTRELVDQRHAFGMSHTFGLLDQDGDLDFYMVGMSSTTARRLDLLGLGRDDFAQYNRMRAPMTYGNRLYQSQQGRFVQTKRNESIARAGWSWGCSAFDFDNDADDDIYVANGHISGQSSRDYCTRYWCHDVYTGTSNESPEIAKLLTDDFRPPGLRGLDSGAISWNGYETNRFFLNVGPSGFLDVGFLMGVGYQFDCRSVVTPDLDADGRLDLLVVQNRWHDAGGRIVARHALLVHQNRLESKNHWIGVRLRSDSPSVSPIGARVIIQGAWGSRQRRIVTGDSYYSQSPWSVHFGLGTHERIDQLCVVWPNGQIQKVSDVEPDRYHVIRYEEPL